MSKLVKKYLNPNSGVQYTGFDWWNRKPITSYEDIINEPLPNDAPKSKGSPTLNRVKKVLNNLVNAPVLPAITGSAPTLGTNTYGSTIGKELGVAAAGAGSIAAPAIAGALAPGSAFWAHPLTLQTVLGTLGGEALNLASQATTGSTWGLGVGNIIGLTGWNPNNYALGRIATDMTNPGYFFSPAKFNFLAPSLKLPSYSLFLPRPKITSPGISTPMWTQFPEWSESPIYPDVSFFFNKGGKLIERLK